jgi:MFS family permease
LNSLELFVKVPAMSSVSNNRGVEVFKRSVTIFGKFLKTIPEGLCSICFLGIAGVYVMLLWAIHDGIEAYFGITSGFVSLIVYMFSGAIAGIPVLGGVLGVYGAVNAWDWALWKAIALFSPFIFLPILGLLVWLVGLICDTVCEKLRRKLR